MSDTLPKTKAYSVGFSPRREPAQKGERRELWQALVSLNPLQRLLILSSCCRLSPVHNLQPLPTNKGTLTESYKDFTLLVTMYRADYDKVATRVIEYARTGRIDDVDEKR